jgi:hypothetical protein
VSHGRDRFVVIQADALLIANVMESADSQLWTFDGTQLLNKLSALYLTVEGSRESQLNRSYF